MCTCTCLQLASVRILDSGFWILHSAHMHDAHVCSWPAYGFWILDSAFCASAHLSSRIQYPRQAVQHPEPAPLGEFWMLGQNPVSAPGRPTSRIRAFWGIAGRCGRTQSPRRAVQHPESAPFRFWGILDAAVRTQRQSPGRRMQDAGDRRTPTFHSAESEVFQQIPTSGSV